jgi:signal transduction histidine kinase
MQPRSLRTHLFALVVATALPLLLFGIAAIAWSAWEQTRASERDLIERAAAVALAVRRELGAGEAMLRGVAVTEVAGAGPALVGALRPLADASGGWIMVFDGEARLRASTLGAAPQTPDEVRRPWIEEAWRTREIRVSDLHVGRASGREVVTVFVPALRDGQPVAVLALALPPGHLAGLLAVQPLPPGTVALLVDGAGRIIAASRDHADLLGTPALQAARERDAGLIEGVGSGGTPSTLAFHRVAGTSWTVALAVPSAGLWWQRMTVPLALAATVLLLLALAARLAAKLAESIAEPVRALAASAERIVAGEPVPASAKSPVAEVADLERALVHAGENERARRVEESRRAAAEAASLAKDELLATVSHELRTPLQSVSAWTRTLAMRGHEPEVLARAVNVIERSVRQVVRLLDGLLDASRLAVGQARLEPAVVDLAALLRQQLEAAQPLAAQKQLDIVADLPAELQLTADPARLEQVVANLLGNAIKFTPTGGRIRVSLALASTDLRLAVADDGPGIAAEALPHVFERYWQGQRTQQPGRGAGLGLAIAKQLVELHGGRIKVESEGLGRGATFIITLPVREAQATRVPA